MGMDDGWGFLFWDGVQVVKRVDELPAELPAADAADAGLLLGVRRQVAFEMFCPVKLTLAYWAGLSEG